MLKTITAASSPDYMAAPRILISVVSHRQSALVDKFLSDVAALPPNNLRVILTLNVPEEMPPHVHSLGDRIRVLRNAAPKGFGANHNAAFSIEPSEYFCIANPDIRLREDPYPALIETLMGMDVGLAAPLVLATDGSREDSARRFPTPLSLATKAVRKSTGRPELLDYPDSTAPFQVDWAAGMFLLLPSEIYQALGGFDESYFLYYEDVDLCARLRLSGRKVVVNPAAHVIHDARRTSHHRPKYAWWHAKSIARYLASAPYRELRRRQLA